MTVASLEKKIVVDEKGKPLEVIIPYEQYVEFVETYGLDLSEEEKASLREAQADLAAGNKDAFVSMEEVRRELGCTE